MRDALEDDNAVNCTFVFDGETIVNENVYIISVTKRYRLSYDLNKIANASCDPRIVHKQMNRVKGFNRFLRKYLNILCVRHVGMNSENTG